MFSPQFGVLFGPVRTRSVRVPPLPVVPPLPLPPPPPPPPRAPPPLAAIAGRIVIAIRAATIARVLSPLRRGPSYGSPSRYSSYDFAMLQPPRYVSFGSSTSPRANLMARTGQNG